MEITSDGWANSDTVDAYMAYAIEFDGGYTLVVSDSQTLSRMTGLYHECGVEVSHFINEAHNKDGDLILNIMALRVEEKLSTLDVEHSQMIHLKGHPVVVWGGVHRAGNIDDEEAWELTYPPITCKTIPMLAFRLASDQPGLIFGLSSQLEYFASKHKDSGGSIMREMWNEEKTKLSTLEIAADEFFTFTDSIKATGQHIFIRNWVPSQSMS